MRRRMEEDARLRPRSHDGRRGVPASGGRSHFPRLRDRGAVEARELFGGVYASQSTTAALLERKIGFGEASRRCSGAHVPERGGEAGSKEGGERVRRRRARTGGRARCRTSRSSRRAVRSLAMAQIAAADVEVLRRLWREMEVSTGCVMNIIFFSLSYDHRAIKYARRVKTSRWRWTPAVAQVAAVWCAVPRHHDFANNASSHSLVNPPRAHGRVRMCRRAAGPCGAPP